jgi:hypothetical protein
MNELDLVNNAITGRMNNRHGEEIMDSMNLIEFVK